MNVIHIKFNGFLIVVQIYSWTVHICIVCALRTAPPTNHRNDKHQKKTKQITTNWWLNLWKIAFPTVADGGAWCLTINYCFFPFALHTTLQHKNVIIVFAPVASRPWMKMFTENKTIFFFPLTTNERRAKKMERKMKTLCWPTTK